VFLDVVLQYNDSYNDQILPFAIQSRIRMAART